MPGKDGGLVPSKTEFPDYELLAAVQIFRLMPVKQASAADQLEGQSAITDLQATLLSQVAKSFGVDANRLPTQFLEHRRLAQDIVDKQPNLPVPQAWQLALKQTQDTSRRRKHFSADALLPVLARYVVAPGSTSGVEQTLSRFKRVLGEHWQGSEQAEERRLVLELEAASCDDPARVECITNAARVVWVASGLGAPRFSGTTRKARLKVRVLEQQKLAQARAAKRNTAASWLLHRRQQVGEAAQRTDKPAQVDESVTAAAAAAWSEHHQKELDRQLEVRGERTQAAMTEGSVCVDSVGDNVGDNLRKYADDEARRQATGRLSTQSSRRLQRHQNFRN